MLPTDPWTTLLDWLSTVIVPNWTQLVGMLPFFLLLGVAGPLLSLIVLLWVWYFFKRRRAHVSVTEPDAVPAPLDAGGRPLFPPNAPYCLEHAVVYPPSRTACEVDGSNLAIRCPVDGTVRPATQQTCTACGTRFVLGSGSTPALVRRSGHPPEGGAAAA